VTGRPAAHDLDDDSLADALAAHLVRTRLAGRVATPVESCLHNSARLVAGDPDYTFGLSDWKRATVADALAALADCGVALGEGPAATPYVDPHAALQAVRRQRRTLAQLAGRRARVLVATGHAFALLPHYAALARRLRAAGCTVLQPTGVEPGRTDPDAAVSAVRFFDGVASLVAGGALQHTHRPDYMEAMLAELGASQAPDAVIGDHGFAGAAVEAGIPTLSIADVNDPALPLAQARGRTDGVLVVDDGLDPAVYEPLTAALVDGLPG
jgi:hypothetical protein